MGALVAESMKVLNHPRPEPEIPKMIERDGVRSKLRIDRTTGIVPLATIRPDPDQPRKVDTNAESFRELVASVKDHGVIQPITVRHVEDGDYFRIVAGERRYRAAIAAGLSEIPAIVKDLDDTATAVQQLEENIQRKNLNPLEEAEAIRRLMSATGETQEQVAGRIHKSKSYVSKLLAIDQQLTREEKADLALVSGGNNPGISLIYAALRARTPEIRAAILTGKLKTNEADRRAKASRRGRRPAFVRVLHVEDLGALVSVRFPKRTRVPAEAVLQALDAAREAFKRELRD
jgi:ParB/RepB/Spo0J family partition protein